MEMVLSLGMIGDKNGDAKVECPWIKKISLNDVSNLGCDHLQIEVYTVKIENGNVYIGFED